MYRPKVVTVDVVYRLPQKFHKIVYMEYTSDIATSVIQIKEIFVTNIILVYRLHKKCLICLFAFRAYGSVHCNSALD